MMKKTAVLCAVALVAGSVSLASARGARHHNTTNVVQQTTMVGTFIRPQDNESQGPAETPAPPEQPGEAGESTLVSANIHNRIDQAGDITSIVTSGDNNQANAASIAITGNSQVSGKVVNRINTAGNITATVEDGSGNLANAGTVSMRGAVSSGKVMNRVRETGDITSMVSGGDNNQANAASIAVN